ncbi:MAG: hypothetical protein EBU04_06875 [Verrucomicrobia bacterium]|nr:hypothetical protein [Verrucomicrobiota bacterium]
MIVKSIDPNIATPYIQRLFSGREIDAEGKGPWIELIGKAGTPTELNTIYQSLVVDIGLKPSTQNRIATALLEAARNRNTRPDGDLGAIGHFLSDKTNKELKVLAVQIIGQWKMVQFIPQLAEFAGRENDAPLREAAFAALRAIGQKAKPYPRSSLKSKTSLLSPRFGASFSRSPPSPNA